MALNLVPRVFPLETRTGKKRPVNEVDGLSLSLLRRSSKGFATRSFPAREYSNIEKPQNVCFRNQTCLTNTRYFVEELCVTYYTSNS